MSYHYSSYQKTTTTHGGITTTTTRTSSNDSSTLIVREISESEASKLPMLKTSSQYEITDEDKLTPFDISSLLDSDDDSMVDLSSESDVEYHWFPSLLKRSVIEFLDDSEGEEYMEEDYNAIVIEHDDSSEEELTTMKQGAKRLFGRQSTKLNKRPRKSDLVPVEVVHVIL